MDLDVPFLKQVAQRATIAHLSPMCQGQISFQKIQTHPSFNACSCYMKVSKGSNQKQHRKCGNIIFPIIRSIGVFIRRSRAANFVVGGPIWPKFELIHNIMHVLVTSKVEKDPININRDYVMTSIFRRSRAASRSQWWDLSEIQTHISFYVCPHYLQVWKGSDQKQPRKRDDFVFPIISL